MNTANRYPLKILHMPCNTPYTRKIKKEREVTIVNGSNLSACSIPFEIKYQWILEHQNDEEFWGSFDICHLHYGFEFEKLETVKTALQLFRQSAKPIIYTCHELCSTHGVRLESYAQYLALIFEYAEAVITLTDEAKSALMAAYPQASSVTVIPHGFVALPEASQENIEKNNKTTAPEILLFGALRSNRDVLATLINLMLGTDRCECHVTWVTRPFTHQQLANSSILRTYLALMALDTRSHLELTLPLSDGEVETRVKNADILILPYLSAGHSGQLELAYDCGVLPVVSKVGFLNDQQEIWPKEDSKIPNAILVDWTDEKHWLYQTRLIAAVRAALKIFPSFRTSLNVEKRRAFRISEHETFLARHLDIYRRSLVNKR